MVYFLRRSLHPRKSPELAPISNGEGLPHPELKMEDFQGVRENPQSLSRVRTELIPPHPGPYSLQTMEHSIRSITWGTQSQDVQLGIISMPNCTKLQNQNYITYDTPFLFWLSYCHQHNQ